MSTERDPGDQQHPPATPSGKMHVAHVLLPDGVRKEFEVNKTSEGEALFQQVTRDLSIEEREYFSLSFYDKEEGTRHWLYDDKQISKQIKSLPWEFSFEVKFYPTTPTTIVDDHARYYLFLQLRRDLLTGRLPATSETHALLGSFVAQMEFKDAPGHIADEYKQFIVGAKLVPTEFATPEIFTKIAELHRELRGRTPNEAELMFLDHSKRLALYGIHLFKAQDKDKKQVDIGVGAAGINIYQDNAKIHSFNWQNIIKIGYKRTYFSIKLKEGTIGKGEKTLYYKCPTNVASKRAWKCAVEHHTFFRPIQPEDTPDNKIEFVEEDEEIPIQEFEEQERENLCAQLSKLGYALKSGKIESLQFIKMSHKLGCEWCRFFYPQADRPSVTQIKFRLIETLQRYAPSAPDEIFFATALDGPGYRIQSIHMDSSTSHTNMHYFYTDDQVIKDETRKNPDMVVEKTEVRQETTQ